MQLNSGEPFYPLEAKPEDIDINDIAHALGKKTIAEFVENEESFQILIELGVDFGQGYHLGRPDVVAPCNAISAHAGVAGYCRV